MKLETLIKKEMVGTTKFEVENFIIGAQESPHRIIRQIQLEASTRYSSVKTVERDIKKLKIKKQKIEVEIERKKDRADKTADPFERKLLHLDIEELKVDLEDIEAQLFGKEDIKRTWEIELEYLQEALDKIEAKLGRAQIEELIKKENFEKHEAEYWIQRLTRQAATDMLATGSITQGNYEAILNLPNGVKEEALAVLMQKVKSLPQSFAINEALTFKVSDEQRTTVMEKLKKALDEKDKIFQIEDDKKE